MFIVIHHFLLAQEKTPKDLNFSKSKDACVFPFNAVFQSRWNDGGSAGWSAAALEETLDMQNVQAAAALDCSAVEAPLCCDMAATDFVGESSALGAATIVCTCVVWCSSWCCR